MEDEQIEFAGCLSCLNDGYSQKINYLMAALVASLIVIGTFVAAKAQLVLGLPLIVLSLLFGASWFTFDYLNKKDLNETAPSHEPTTVEKKNE